MALTPFLALTLTFDNVRRHFWWGATASAAILMPAALFWGYLLRVWLLGLRNMRSIEVMIELFFIYAAPGILSIVACGCLGLLAVTDFKERKVRIRS